MFKHFINIRIIVHILKQNKRETTECIRQESDKETLYKI